MEKHGTVVVPAIVPQSRKRIYTCKVETCEIFVAKVLKHRTNCSKKLFAISQIKVNYFSSIMEETIWNCRTEFFRKVFLFFIPRTSSQLTKMASDLAPSKYMSPVCQ